MKATTVEPPSGRLSMRRYFWLPIGLSGVLVLLVLAGLVGMSWRSLDRLRPVQEHLAHITQIQNVGLSMEQTLLKGLRGTRVSGEELAVLGRQIAGIAAIEGAMHPDTTQRLARIATRMTHSPGGSVEVLFETLGQVRRVLADERQQHDALLMALAASTRMELRLAIALLIILPVVGGISLFLLQHRTEQPLRDLQVLLNRLAARDFRPLSDEVLKQTTKPALPAFNSYNTLVSRLQELEAEHQDRERLLETRVRKATEALLAQSRELSRAERLAAVGAVSAGLAHEIRNPLAGIQLACSKLQQKLADGDQSRRIEAVIGELKRINHLLTQQVDAARHAPEPAVPTRITGLVSELLALLRYQVPAGFRLQSLVDAGLQCTVPAAGLRQALLNLVLNAVQIQGEAGHVGVAARLDGGWLEISVCDDGPGFPEQTLQAGIRPFATGRAGGTGLGLAMVRRYVRDLDGELRLANRQPHGAEVTLRLPCAGTAEPGDENHA